MQAYKCPYECCPVVSTESDDIAVHVIDRHGWDYEEARIWLKRQVEAEAFDAKP